MGCCIAAALIISLTRRIWFAIFPGRRPVILAFAPPATRPAPGTTLPALHDALSERRRSSSAAAISLAAALYGTTTAVLRITGAVDDLPDPLIGWFARDVLLAAVFGIALIAAYGRRPRDLPRSLAAAGATWTALAIVDLHVFGLFGLSTTGDILFHGFGFVVLCIGLATRRPSTAYLPIQQPEGALL